MLWLGLHRSRLRLGRLGKLAHGPIDVFHISYAPRLRRSGTTLATGGGVGLLRRKLSPEMVRGARARWRFPGARDHRRSELPRSNYPGSVHMPCGARIRRVDLSLTGGE